MDSFKAIPPLVLKNYIAGRKVPVKELDVGELYVSASRENILLEDVRIAVWQYGGNRGVVQLSSGVVYWEHRCLDDYFLLERKFKT